jgi:predicted RNA-binding protein associated with RNAse of E/G family
VDGGDGQVIYEIRDHIEKILETQDLYLDLRKLVGNEAEVIEVLHLARTLAQYGSTKDNVEPLVKWANSAERIRVARDLRRIAGGLVADL